jgi:hypothetical protein
MKLLFSTLFLFMSSYLSADEGVDLTDPGQIADLNILQIELDSVTGAIMGCMDAGMDHLACMCRHKEMIARFNSTANQIFLNHPELDQYDLVRFRSSDGQNIAQSLNGIRNQASIDASCDL